MKRLFGTIFAFVLLCSLLAGGYLYLLSRTPYGQSYKEIHIQRGSSLLSILQTLEHEEIIANAEFFRLYLVARGIAHQVRAGDYQFRPQMTPHQVAEELIKGDFKTYRFTIPEGWSITQIANYLEERGLTKADPFKAVCFDKEWIHSLGIAQDSLEGYLYPSTYETYYPQSPKDLATMMVKKFQTVFTDEMKLRAQQIGLSVHEVVTLASIVEKETGRAEERPLIASVFDNRLKIKMPLQSDPTVIYGIPDFNGNITRRDLSTFTPYNTYVIPGLPPGPIASPGKDALLAVLYPAETEYLYFVSKNNGSHIFSKTLREHNRNVQKYQIRREN